MFNSALQSLEGLKEPREGTILALDPYVGVVMIFTQHLRGIAKDEYLWNPQVTMVMVCPPREPNRRGPRTLATRQLDLFEDIEDGIQGALHDVAAIGLPEFSGVYCYLEHDRRYHTVDFVFRATGSAGAHDRFLWNGCPRELGRPQQWILYDATRTTGNWRIYEHQSVTGRVYSEPYCKGMRRYVGDDWLLSIVAGALVFDEKDRILLHQRSDNRRWGLPQGSVEIGERIEEAAVREVKEETGYTIQCLGLAGVFTAPEAVMIYPSGEKLRFLSFLFKARIIAGRAIKENEETLALGWFDPADLPENTGPVSRKHLEAYLGSPGRPLLG